MALTILKTELKEILFLRALFLQENNVQIRYNACHERGWTDSYFVQYNKDIIGYGSVKGKEKHSDRDTVFEFYLIPSFRHLASSGFFKLLSFSGAKFIECQTNDFLLTLLTYEFSENISSEVILFADNCTSSLQVKDAIFRGRKDGDFIFDHKGEPSGDFIIEINSRVVATGGFLLHYNMPFADLYMEVDESFRRMGLGSFLIQELKQQCYLAGRVPAARCDKDNIASRRTLLTAGFRIAGFMITGNVKLPECRGEINYRG